ncbi:putative HNHc nuclease [Macrococcus armenti]|uniref:putative HNHc nuclease n=1 Tax=Macrococcus armenti TaxID=2875764 RepID=UPI001CCED608|nr:putative HNHc nuclease [Macrococcus armenti]UBH16375.1 hypothetical protein LAU44_05315 [Macrococcus armenti]UBH18731.1 hypothetical protein LAU39_05325 [Macrococcus armenti]UBH21003.1 hypothetical protein LAU40_05320 [Macrococcus armenti]
MPIVSRIKQNNDGTFDVVVEGVQLTDEAMMFIDNGFGFEAEFKVVDSKRITVKQRKKIFALLNDIYRWCGQPQDDLRQMFQFYLEMMNGYDHISLADTTRRIASELIDLIIEFVFAHNVPLNYRTSDLLKEDRYFIYKSTINRTCVICGKSGADIAHRYAVGAGRNRNEIDHYGNEVLALCREHHSEQHQIGMDSFNEKYKLHESWIKVDDKLNKMLRGERHEHL